MPYPLPVDSHLQPKTLFLVLDFILIKLLGEDVFSMSGLPESEFRQYDESNVKNKTIIV